MLALIKAGKKYTTLRKILGIPVAHIAQKLFEIKVSKSLVLIKFKRTFADGSYMQAIACGYHLAKREFIFGHFAGMASDNIRSRINWSESMKIKGSIRYIFVLVFIFLYYKPLALKFEAMQLGLVGRYINQETAAAYRDNNSLKARVAYFYFTYDWHRQNVNK